MPKLLVKPLIKYDQLQFNNYYQQPIIRPNYEMIPTLPGEIWRFVDYMMIPNIVPRYYVSNLGRVFNSSFRSILGGKLNDPTKYKKVGMLLQSGSTINMAVHRLVLLAFNYVPGCEFMLPNHKDGNKSNNCLWNLEWSTYQTNVQHALDTGLTPKGENVPWAKLTDEQVHDVIKMYMERIPNKDICAKYGVAPSTVSDIIGGRTRKDITSQYPSLDFHQYRSLTDEQLHDMCRIIERYYNTESVQYIYYRILFELGMKDDIYLRKRIGKLYRGEAYNDISSQYKIFQRK